MKKNIFWGSPILFAVLVISSMAKGFTLKERVISGNGCESVSKLPAESLDKSEARFDLPLRLNFKNTKDFGTERQSCNFTWSLKVNPGKKIQVRSLHQAVVLSRFEKAQVKAEIKVFLAGATTSWSKTAELSPGSPEKDLRIVWDDSQASIESECGKDTLLRGNLNAFSTGSSTVKTEDLGLTLQEVPCR